MASLLRNSRSILTRFSCIRHTATARAGTHTGSVKEMAVQHARQRSTPVDAFKPRAAGTSPFIPLVGTALNSWGQIGFGVVLAISAYFIYINYITNPEFYKSLKLSREVTKANSQQHSTKHDAAHGH